MALPRFAVAEAKPDKLRALGIMALNGMFDEKDGVGVLKQAVNDLLAGEIAVVSSFGADSSVLLHMVAQVDKTLPVYFLETGKHFPETLQYVETLREHLGLANVRWLRPDPKDVARFDPNGDLWETDPDSCCHIRKTEPLEAEIAQFGGWITGRLPAHGAIFLTHGEDEERNALRNALLASGLAGDQVIMPLLDDAVELQAGGTRTMVAPQARRLDLNQLNADWHNAYSSFIIDLSNRLQAAPTDEERLQLMAGLKDKLGVHPHPPQPTPITPVAATGTILHGEPSGE
jgi:hypothetical protein